MSLPQCTEGCPQHETRVRHKQRHRSRTVSKTSLRGNCMASLLRSNIQDFVQEVSVGQMAQGTPFRCLPWPPPPLFPDFKVLGGGEVKPPKCPTRHPRVGGYIYIYTHMYLVPPRLNLTSFHDALSLLPSMHTCLYMYI